MPESGQPGATRLSSRREALVIATIVVAMFTEIFESSMVGVALPTFVEVFNAPISSVSWTVTAFLISAGVMGVIGGRLGDMFGRRKVLVILLAISCVGSLISALVGTLSAIIVGRVLQGLAAGGIPLGYAIAREVVEPRKVPVVTAFLAGATGAGGAGGFLISGWLIDLGDWRYLFWFGLGLGVTATLLCWFRIDPRHVASEAGAHESDRRQQIRKLDVVGIVLFAAGLALALAGITSISSHGWTSSAVLLRTITGLAILAVWVFWERRQDEPIMDLRLAFHGRLGLVTAITAAAGLSSYAFGNLLTFVLQGPTDAPVGLGFTPTESGVVLMAMGMIGWAFSPLVGKLCRRIGAARCIAIGGVVVAMPYLGLLFTYDRPVGAVTCLIAGGVCTVFIQTGIPITLVTYSPELRTGEVVGANYSLRYVFNGVGTAIIATILSSSAVPATNLPTFTGVWQTLLMVSAFLVVLSGLALVLHVYVTRTSQTARNATVTTVPQDDVV